MEDRATRTTVEYAPGQQMDVYAPLPGCPTVLLWHGRGPSERGVLSTLASSVAALGVAVFVPDWRSVAVDGGRSHLLASLAFVRQHGAELARTQGSFVLAGWSLGGKAAAGLTLAPATVGGWAPDATVCIASGFDTADPITAKIPLDLLDTAGRLPPIHLVHGTRDQIVANEKSRAFEAALRSRAQDVELHESETDHAGVVMTEYDPASGVCVRAKQPETLRAGQVTVDSLAKAACR